MISVNQRATTTFSTEVNCSKQFRKNNNLVLLPQLIEMAKAYVALFMTSREANTVQAAKTCTC